VGIGASLRRHSLIAGLLLVIAPLSVLVIVQFVWLLRLEKAQAIAEGAALDSFLGTVATKVEYFYREAAERSLNLSASLFTQNRIEKAAYYWKQRPANGAKRLFLVDLTKNEFGNFLAFDPDNAKLYTPDASDESLAMVLAANPLHMLNLRQRGMESAALTVDERNPDYRIILNPILDDSGHVVGLAGMILDEEFLRKKLLPSIIASTLAKFLPSAPDGELAVTVKNGAGTTVVAVGDAGKRADQDFAHRASSGTSGSGRRYHIATSNGFRSAARINSQIASTASVAVIECFSTTGVTQPRLSTRAA
jgi:hypothetical protein